MRTINEVLTDKIPGLYYGNRVLLPFRAEILKIVFGDKIITDFDDTERDARYFIKESFTEVYFPNLRNLYDKVSKYSKVKVTVVEAGKDLFEMNNHINLAISVQDHHKLLIEKLDEDTLYFE